MFRLTKTWAKRMRMLAVLGLLALIGVSCNSGGGVKEEIAELRGKLADIESRVDAAQQTADEALELARSALPGDIPAKGESVLLASGIALTYEHEGEQELIRYPIDAVFVYPTYNDFRSAWENRPEVIVELAWTGGAEEGTWQLVFVDRTLVLGDPEVKLSHVNLTHWHEYVVYTPVGIPTDTEPDLSSVVVEQGVQQSIVDTLAIDASVSVELLGENDPDNRPFVQVLLTDRTDGQIEHTLVTILEPLFSLPDPPIDPDPVPPDDLDSAGQQHCSNCVWGVCGISCWWY